jgi:diacylglycerol kinase (ATP)
MKQYHKQSGLSLKSLVQSFKNAFRGLGLLVKYEYNLYIESFLGVVAILLGFVFYISSTEWLSLIIVIGLVIFAELTNTAVEKIMDFVQPEYDERVRDIKDLVAGSVVFTVIVAVAIGCIIFIPKILLLFLN